MTDKNARDKSARKTPGDDPREVQRESAGGSGEVNSVTVTPPTGDRIIVESAEPLPAAPPYLVSPRTLRNLFIASSVVGIALIVGILGLASSGDQGRYTPADETRYQLTLLEAAKTLDALAVNEGGATARIPIEEAMSVVAAQGLEATNAALATAAAPPAAEGEADQAAAGGGVDGQALYEANCASCHQATGEGVPGAFPPLAGHVPALYNADRSYLINVLLYGLQGEIQVEGETYNGQMPAWQQLSDDEIAAILNHISTAWGNEAALQDFQPYEAGEVASARDAALSSAEVYALRQELGLSGNE
jgi:mono/diheme cytochrome c family protein